VQIASAAEAGSVEESRVKWPAKMKGGLLAVPVTRLYNRERVFRASAADVLSSRVPLAYVDINTVDAKKLGIKHGDRVLVKLEGAASMSAQARVDGNAPVGVVVVPRNLAETAAPLAPQAVEISKEG
jgi:predicted molibdopterin-dependent oxidoreductase YjgC